MLGIMGDKKRLGAVIMAKMSGDGKDEMKSGPDVELDSSYAFEDAAKRIISSMEAKDPKALVMAFQDMYRLCDLYCEEEEGGEENADAT